MYNVEFSKVAEKQFFKLEKTLQDRIVASLERCKVIPHAHVKKLINSPFYSLRVGDYRLLLNIEGDKLMILVVEIGHRKNIYD